MNARLNAPLSTYRQRAFSEALFMSIGDGAIVTDSAARINRINQRALDILGYKEKDLLGKWFPETIIAEDEQGNVLSNLERPIGQVFLTGKALSIRTYYRRKDGSRVPVEMNVSPVIINGRPAGAIEVFRDISDLLGLERAKDEFVALASHQLRTPATAVKQYVGLMLEGYAGRLSSDQKKFLEMAYESNERQLQIVQEILKVTQLDLEKLVLKPAITNVSDIIRRAADGLRGHFKARQQKLIIGNCRHPLKVRVDAEQVQVAIENLLENASNYTWEGKTVTVSCRRLKDKVRVSIRDEGVGIDPADFPKLFKKFSRIDNPLSMETNGTGLGLYWANRIIEMHGGVIIVKSTPGRGSTFNVDLPAHS